MRCFRMILTVTAVGFLATAPRALGIVTCEYQSAQSGDWDVLATWECYLEGTGWMGCGDPRLSAEACYGLTPRSGDKATILAHTVTINETKEVIHTLIMPDSTGLGPAYLEIKSTVTAGNSRLRIENTLDMDAVGTAAKISFINGSSGNPGQLVAYGHDITADGDIDASGSEGGEIKTESTYCFTLGVPGYMSPSVGDITINGCFENDGEVNVSANTVKVAGAGVNAGSQGKWDLSGGKIWLAHTSAILVNVAGGQFDISGGTLQVDKAFEFYGGLEWRSQAVIDCDSMPTNDTFDVRHQNP